MKPFAQRIVYDLVVWHGPTSVAFVCDLSGLSLRFTSTCLRRLKDKGCVINSGKTHRSRWAVAGPPPENMAGRTKGSEIGRAVARARWRSSLAKAAVARGRDPSPFLLKVSEPTCELDRCWGMGINHPVRHGELEAS